MRVKGKSEDEKESKKEALMSIEGHNDLLNERMFYICLHMMYLIITRWIISHLIDTLQVRNYGLAWECPSLNVLEQRREYHDVCLL